MYRIDSGHIKLKRHTAYRKATYVIAAVLAMIGISYPLSVAAQATPSASINVNGKRSTTLSYGSDASLAWNTDGLDECAVTPGNWNGLQGNKTLSNITAKQTYTLTCTGQAASASAYATFAVLPPTYQYLQDYLSKSAKTHGTDAATIRGTTQQITRAKAYYQSGKLDKSRKLLDRTVSRVNRLADRGKLPASDASNYATAVNRLIASWGKSQPVPDIIPEDSVTLNKPANGGYPSQWADAPINSLVDTWGMYNRQSVSYTAFKVAASGRYMPYWGGRGNANQWDDNARAAGIVVDTTPTPGSVAIRDIGAYGHAMYVEEVGMHNGQPAVYISQYNAIGDGTYSEGWRPLFGLVFIHF